MPESADEDLNNIDYELSPIFNAVNRDSERSAVMVAAAHLSELLRRLIQGYLIDNGGTKDLFSGPTAALSSFSARASAAFALGLISPDEFRCLTLVRRIRNAFAHEVRASFLDVKIVSKCFMFDDRVTMPDTDGRNASIIKRQEAGRACFSAHANYLIILMTMRHKSSKLPRLKSPLEPLTANETKQ